MPATATVLRTGIVPILQAVENRLVAKAVVPVNNLVKWVVGPRPKAPTLDSNFDIVLWIRGFTAMWPASAQTGAQRHNTLITRRLDVIPRVQGILDEPDRMKVWLSGSGSGNTFVQGYFPAEEQIIDALLWQPLDVSGNHLTACDLHLLTGVDPEKESGGWGHGTISFEVRYRFPFTQGYGQ